jgi:hypothetical protein
MSIDPVGLDRSARISGCRRDVHSPVRTSTRRRRRSLFRLRFGVVIFLVAPTSDESIAPRSAGHEDRFVAPPARGPAVSQETGTRGRTGSSHEVSATPSTHPGRDAICSPEGGHAFEIIPLRRSLAAGPAPLADLSAGAVRPCGFALAHVASRNCFTRCTHARPFSLEHQTMRCCSMWGTTCWTSDRFRRAA